MESSWMNSLSCIGCLSLLLKKKNTNPLVAYKTTLYHLPVLYVWSGLAWLRRAKSPAAPV